MIRHWLRFRRAAATETPATPSKNQPPPDPRLLAPFVAVLAAPDFVLGKWQGDETQAQYLQHSPDADAFVFAASQGQWVRPDIRWSDFAVSEVYRRLRSDPSAVAMADVEQLACLLTTLIRGDRFNEGLLASAFEDGTLLAIAKRMARLGASQAGPAYARCRPAARQNAHSRGAVQQPSRTRTVAAPIQA